uniref:Uncharacterized protein n=1 Tax=Castor canadensis TaxID=51338 RepID=A0A8C0X9S0_CASCN
SLSKLATSWAALFNPAARQGTIWPLEVSMTSSNNRPREDSWLKSLFVRKVDPRKDAHSNLLAKRETSSLYKLQFHNVKPECLDSYNKICQEVLPKIHEDKHYPCTLVGTWNTWYGEQDQAGRKQKPWEPMLFPLSLLITF